MTMSLKKKEKLNKYKHDNSPQSVCFFNSQKWGMIQSKVVLYSGIHVYMGHSRNIETSYTTKINCLSSPERLENRETAEAQSPNTDSKKL